jgi:molybdopterin synthase sulfur carrier subunit
MAKVRFTTALNRFFPDLKEIEVEAPTLNDVIQRTDEHFPGIKGYLLEEDGSLRKHVNIFIDEELIRDRRKLTDDVAEKNEILIFQALSGG